VYTTRRCQLFSSSHINELVNDLDLMHGLMSSPARIFSHSTAATDGKQTV
jgi:hypothetical protein